MHTVKQVLEKFAENPAEIIGQLLVAIHDLMGRVKYLEDLLSQDDPYEVEGDSHFEEDIRS